MTNTPRIPSPIATGGVGGSGTRVVAALLSTLGVFIGHKINTSNDIMIFPRFLEIEDDWAFEDSPDNHRIAMSEIARFEKEMLQDFREFSPEKLGWGWKAPPTFFFLRYFAECFPSMRYIHVIRHGLDMAYSNNTNQMEKIGHKFGIAREALPRAAALLKYWIAANSHAIAEGRDVLGEKFLLLSFDSLCVAPRPEIERLAEFIGLALSDDELDRLCQLVIPPPTIGRYEKQQYSDTASEGEVEEVRKYGFEVTTPGPS